MLHNTVDALVNDVRNADVIFVTDLSRRSISRYGRYHMFCCLLDDMELNSTVIHFPEDIGGGDQSSQAQLWEMNLSLYDLLDENRKAPVIILKPGNYCLGLLLTMSWQSKQFLLDYADLSEEEAEAGFKNLATVFPSFGGGEMLEQVIKNSSACFTALQSIHNNFIDHNLDSYKIFTPVDFGHFKGSKDQRATINLLWKGEVNTPDQAKKMLLVYEYFTSLPKEILEKTILVFCGEGELWEQVIEHIKVEKTCAMNIDFIPVPNYQELPGILKSIDVLLTLDHPRDEVEGNEHFDIKTIMASRVAVCCFNSEALVARFGSNSVLNSNDGENFRENLIKLLSDESLRMEYAERARKNIQERYNLETVRNDYLMHIKRALHGQRKGRSTRFDASMDIFSHPHLFS